MKFLQNVFTFMLALAGLSITGLLYLGYTSSISTSTRNTVERSCFKLEKEHQLPSPNGDVWRYSDCGDTQQSPWRYTMQLTYGLYEFTMSKANTTSNMSWLSYNQPSAVGPDGRVVPLAPWLAPVVQEGTFDPILIDSIYKQQNITIATTVFALGKYTRFLKDFLESAEQNYFVGFRVHYYVFTDHPEEVPAVKLSEEHHLTVLTVPSSNRWQDISLSRMARLEKLIESRLFNEADYIFSLDVDSKFYGHWGVETLSPLVGVIHAWFYGKPRKQFTYERRPESQAFIPYNEGDYYYGGAVIGGLVKNVYRLVKTCREQLDIDASKSIEAVWQEESHLNKYFLYNKPSKLLSPEYLWDDTKSKPDEIKIIRFSQVIKNYNEIRPNP